MRLNKAGIELIKQFEGCKLEVYHCSANKLTIGYGHTGPDVKPKIRITQDQAESLLEVDLRTFEAGVRKLLKVECNENEFSALVSFAFNLGLGSLGKSTLLKLLNEGKKTEAAEQFLVWNKVNGVPSKGIARRREAERALFLKPVSDNKAA